MLNSRFKNDGRECENLNLSQIKAKNALFILKNGVRNILDYLGLLSSVKKILGK